MALHATPQIQLNASQLSTIWTGLRHLLAGNSRASSSSRIGEGERITAGAVSHSAETVDSVPTCASLLKDFDWDLVTATALHPSQRSHWKVSHKSEDAFHKNLSRADMSFDINVQEVCSAVFGSKLLKYSPGMVNNVMYQQIRGFKTNRSETATGITGAKRLERITPARVPASSANTDGFEWFNQSSSNDTDGKGGLAKLLANVNLSPEEETRVKISFADGYQAGGDWKTAMAGVRETSANPLRMKAFLEGYKSHSLGTTSKRSSPVAKALSGIIRFSMIVVMLVSLVLLLGPNISIKKVSFLNGERYEVNPETITETFDDVRGSAEAKAELASVVDFLKNPSKYTDLGAKLPNGVLLVGPPGVGKTLLAKAVAGEAGVPFFQASGAEFDEVYVGTGAKRVRQLFQAAKAKAPCVLFIDEIDSVGSKRTSSEMHPYANQTVNQLLTEMDGFQPNEGVIVLGATNKKENLDKALLRPGRFDVEVSIRHPDLNDRKEILALYLPKLVTDGNLDVTVVAQRTSGCTGADIFNICNHAAMKAASEGESRVTMHHIEFAIDKVRMGPQKKRIPTEQVNVYTAFHEAGHALVGIYSDVKSAKTLHKVTILPRGSALGMTMHQPTDKREFQYTKEEVLADIDVAMGGRVAEEIIFGGHKVSTGCSSDMEAATRLAKMYVSKSGFSEKVGLRYHHASGDIISEKVKQEIDEEINRILKESFERVKMVLGGKQKELQWLGKALLKYEELNDKEVKIIIMGGTLDRAPPTSGKVLHFRKPDKMETAQPVQM